MVKMKKSIIIIFVVLVILPVCLYFIKRRADEGNNFASNSITSEMGESSHPITFEKSFGGAGWDESRCVIQTNDGGYIVVGTTGSIGAGKSDIYLIRTDAEGNEIWEKTYGGENDDVGSCVAPTSDGGYIIVGETKSFGARKGDIYLIKTDAEGNEIWEKNLGGDLEDLGNCIQRTADGGYIIAGVTWRFGRGSEVYLVKIDAEGNEIWEKTFGGRSWDEGHWVVQTSDDGYILVGRSWSIYGTGDDVYLIKTDSMGNKLWEKTLDSGGHEEGNCVLQTVDGGYIIAGTIHPAGSGGLSDILLIKTDARGNKLWEKTFGGKGWDHGYSISRTKDGGYILVGDTWIYPGLFDVYLIKIDSQGNEIWEKKFGGELDDCGRCVAQTTDGGAYYCWDNGSENPLGCRI
jgi:hypothetical protein